jgi:hypothetical protein
MLIMPLAILLLSSTIVMAISNPMLPSTAYAITFGASKNLSNNDGNSGRPQIEASGNNVYTVWGDGSKGGGDTFFKRSTTSGDSFQNTKDLSNGIDGEASNIHIVKEGNNVYVVWTEGGSFSDSEVYFKRSTDNGASFGSTINLSNDGSSSQKPEIAVAGDNVYVVWVDVSDGEDHQLFFKRSTDNGASFSSVKKLDMPHVFTFHLDTRIAASGNNVYIAFAGGGEESEEVFFTKSTNKGSSFSKVISINNNDEDSFLGDIAAKGSNVYIVWGDSSLAEEENVDIFFKRSTDNGNSFGSIKNFGPGAGPGSSPQLDTISSNVYTVWADADGNIAFKASKNNGASFGNTKILGDGGDPQISSSGNAVRIVWEGNSDILFRASGNEGDSFGSTKNLSDNAGESLLPQIISSGGKVYVVWQDDTPGNSDIFFKKGVD